MQVLHAESVQHGNLNHKEKETDKFYRGSFYDVKYRNPELCSI